MKKLFMFMWVLSFSVSVAAEALVREVSVTGQGQVAVVPDRVTITFGVRETGQYLDDTKKRVDKRMAKVFAVINDHGVDPKFVQTSQVEISTNYDHQRTEGGGNKLLGFTVFRQVGVTLEKVENFEPLLEGVVNAGANEVRGIRFSSSRTEQLMAEVKILALRNAKAEAGILAKELGMKVGKPIKITENQNFRSYGG